MAYKLRILEEVDTAGPGEQGAILRREGLYTWYNEHHRHGGIALLTPDDVYCGRADALLAQRQRRLLAAYEAHPERFPNGPPVVQSIPNAVYISPPPEDGEQSLARTQ